jgi:dTDP-glucose pyrophosphorylase
VSLDNLIIDKDASVRDTIRLIDANKKKTAFVVDKDMKLLGIFTDGDMRKYLLTNGDLNLPIVLAMNKEPVVFQTIEEAEKAMLHTKMIVYPVVDANNVLKNALFLGQSNEEKQISNELFGTPLVMMAGGKGTRLYPYTKILPKSLIPIGDLTISERIINQFVRYGCQDVWLILNHKANMIKAFYNDLEKEYSVNYIDEQKFLGTGGGLSLLKGKINKTFFVSNCDILVNADLECVLRTHKQQKNIITFVCAMKNVMIPYGVINLDQNGCIQSMSEKPQYSFLTNTGLYVLEPEVIDNLKDDEFIHLPDIAQRYIEEGKKVGVFPISEKAWLDMGQFTEMEAMMKELGI